MGGVLLIYCNTTFIDGFGAGATLVDYALTYDGAAVTAKPVTNPYQFAEAAWSFASTSALPVESAITVGTYSDLVTIVVTFI